MTVVTSVFNECCLDPRHMLTCAILEVALNYVESLHFPGFKWHRAPLFGSRHIWAHSSIGSQATGELRGSVADRRVLLQDMKDMVAPVSLGAGENPEKCASNHFLKQAAAIKILYENISTWKVRWRLAMQAYFVLSQTSPHCGMNLRQDVFFLRYKCCICSSSGQWKGWSGV